MTGEREVCYRCHAALEGGRAYELGDAERRFVAVCRSCALVVAPGLLARMDRRERAEATIRHRRHRAGR